MLEDHVRYWDIIAQNKIQTVFCARESAKTKPVLLSGGQFSLSWRRCTYIFIFYSSSSISCTSFVFLQRVFPTASRIFPADSTFKSQLYFHFSKILEKKNSWCEVKEVEKLLRTRSIIIFDFWFFYIKGFFAVLIAKVPSGWDLCTYFYQFRYVYILFVFPVPHFCVRQWCRRAGRILRWEIFINSYLGLIKSFVFQRFSFFFSTLAVRTTLNLFLFHQVV
jgi:hypothetical protein